MSAAAGEPVSSNACFRGNVGRDDEPDGCFVRARDEAAANDRRIYPPQDDPCARRVEMRLQGVSARGFAIIAIDDPEFGNEREPRVRIAMSPTQVADVVRRL